MKQFSEMRFKTKEEVIKEFGSYERFIDSTLWNGNMDYLFGTPLNNYKLIDCDEYHFYSDFRIKDEKDQRTWMIQFSMITPITKKEEKPIKLKPVVWIDQTSDKGISIAYAVSGYDTEVVITYENKMFKGKAHRRKNEPNIPAVGFSLALSRAADKAIEALGQIPMFYRVDTGEVR